MSRMSRATLVQPKSLLVLAALAGLLAGGGESAFAARSRVKGSGAASLNSAAAAADAPWEGAPFAADPGAIARAAAKVESDGDDVVVLLMEASYGFDEAGRETFSQRLVYRILTANAHESWSTLEEGWEPWHQARPEIRARVITPDGAEHALDPSTISESSPARDAPDMFEDGRVLRAPLPATRLGAVVEQQVTVRDTAPFFDGGVVRLHSLDPGMPVRHARVTLEAPAAMPLRWVARELPGVSPREEVTGGRRRLTFEARGLEPADDPEAGLPADVPRAAYVAFSTGRSWADLARRYSEIVDRSIRGADVAPFLKAASASSPADSQLDTINRLLARMSDEVRYTGMELGEGGLIPRTPAETLKRRFGDCKDKAVLLTSLLRAVDIPAYVALLNAGEDDQDVEESLPGFGLFNHAIVVVPGSPALWIDPTDPYARAGELPVADQGRLALVASPTAAGLVRTPEATSAENRQIETREVYLADLGPSRIVETSVYQGAIERDIRALYSLQDAQTVRQALKDYAAAAYLADDLAAVEHSKAADLSTPMQLRLEVKNARRGFTDERNAAVGLSPAALLNRLPDELTSAAAAKAADAADAAVAAAGKADPRQGDYVFSRPSTVEVRYRIVPPVGYAPQALPAARTRHLGPATLSEEYAAGADNVVTATFRLDTGKRRISPAEFEALRAGVHEALQDKVALLTFDQTGEARLSAGQVREALAEFQRLASLAPKAALPRTRIARALLAGGMGEAAREEARRATQLEPKLAPAWRHLGWVLQHDEIGRRFGAGFDRAGAIAAYRKARELDPKDPLGRTDLAVLLEHDAAGVRYSPQADLGAAIDEYRALKKDLGAKNVDDNLLIALVRAGRFPEAKELAAQMKDSQTGALYSLVATAATDGVDAAVREGERAFSDDRARASALQTAAQTLTLARRYPEAAALMERAGRQTDNPAALLSMAEMLRRARRHEEIVLPPGQPATPGRRLLALTLGGKLDVKQVAALFSRDLAPEILKTGPQTQRLVEAGLGQARRQLRSQDVPADVALDFALGVVQEAVTGDDASGYRVGFSFPFKQSGASFEVYVVPDGSEYRIAALSTATSMLGDEALRRAGRGDLAGARKWLDWALEETGNGNGGGGSGHGGSGGNGASGANTGGAADPLPANPFAVLWTPGSNADAGEIRCAAAVLTAANGDGARQSALLRSCGESAADPARRIAFDVALALGAVQSGSFADLEDASKRLLVALPGSERAAQLQALALTGLGRWDELRPLAERQLQRSPDQGWARELLSLEAIHAGDLDRAEAQLRQSIQGGKASANDFNQLAWLLLERGRVDDATLDFGQRAATLSDYKQPAFLHTLACLYAEQGRTAEAYRIVLQSIGARADEAPSAEDWYVFGRLAEQYGLPDVARKYYRKVAAPTSPDGEPMSTHALAARRLAALGDDRKPLRRAAS
jgi:tetratricopeptide (TPR) repeat protein/transglutaminase-like putative cysteine protease